MSKETVVESSIYDPGFAASNHWSLNLDEIIDEIPFRAKAAGDFVFQIRTSDVEEWVDISRRVLNVRPILQILNADKVSRIARFQEQHRQFNSDV